MQTHMTSSGLTGTPAGSAFGAVLDPSVDLAKDTPHHRSGEPATSQGPREPTPTHGRVEGA